MAILWRRNISTEFMHLDTPYYAVIFTSTRTVGDNGYASMANLMEEMAKQAIADWKQQTEHILAQKKGISDWYGSYKVRICLVEREYSFSKEN